MIDNKTSLKGLSGWLFGAFSLILFWRYYFSKDTYRREVMIYECVLFHRLLFSHIVFVISIMVLIQANFSNDDSNAGSLVFMLIFFSAIHWIAQLVIGIPYYSKEDLKRSKERWAAYNEYLKTLPRTSFDDFMDDLIGVFFGNNQSSQTTSQKGKNRKNHSEERPNISAEKNEVEKILLRFDLPSDTRDFLIVKKRFKQLAKRYHPDMPNGNEAMFKTLMLDFDVLNEYFNQQSAI